MQKEFNQKLESKPYSFQLLDSEKWIPHLQQVGYVVIKNVVSQSEVNHAINLFWEWLESIGSGIKKEDPSTWDQSKWPGMKKIGFFCSYGGCHSKASWFLRTHPNVRKAFQSIWKTQDLITSFDTFIAWKPWWVDQKWAPQVENLHIDQNPYYKKGFKCVQGMIPLKRVRNDQVGGLMIVPYSNNDATQQELIKNYPETRFFPSDWIQLKDNDPYITKKKGKLIQCDAGDLILWDSRSIHGGKICQPTQQYKTMNRHDFVRLSLTVTMLPRSSATTPVLQQRRKCFQKKIGLTHWANQVHKSSMGGYIEGITTQMINYEWPKLKDENIKKLV